MKNKKSQIFGFIILIPFLSFSQTDSISEFPGSGDFMIEINFKPFNAEEIFSFDNLQTKLWLTNKVAFRFGVQIDSKKNSISENDYNADEDYKITLTEESFLYGIKSGVEFKLFSNSKISPYCGIDFFYNNKSSKADYKRQENYYNVALDLEYIVKEETNVKGGWNSGYSSLYENERAYNSLGANLLFGSDYSWFDPKANILQVLLANISDEIKLKILRENALNVYRIDE